MQLITFVLSACLALATATFSGGLYGRYGGNYGYYGGRQLGGYGYRGIGKHDRGYKLGQVIKGRVGLGKRCTILLI